MHFKINDFNDPAIIDSDLHKKNISYLAIMPQKSDHILLANAFESEVDSNRLAMDLYLKLSMYHQREATD